MAEKENKRSRKSTAAIVDEKVEQYRQEIKSNSETGTVTQVVNESPKPTAEQESVKVEEEKSATENPPAEEEQKLDPGPMPAGFCLGDAGVWAKLTEFVYEEGANSCEACKTDAPEAYVACVERHKMVLILAGTEKKQKKRSSSGTKAPKREGPTQTDLINTLLKEKKTIEEIGAAVAAAFYNDNVSAGTARAKGHIKSVLANACVSAKLFAPGELSYLFPKKEEPKSEAGPKEETAVQQPA